MKSVIVTGANGFIGSTLINKLVEDGIKVLAIDVSFSPSHMPESDKVTIVETFITNSEDLTAKIPEGLYDAFYHSTPDGISARSSSVSTFTPSRQRFSSP